MRNKIKHRFLVNVDPVNFEIRDLSLQEGFNRKGKYIQLYDINALKRWLKSNSEYMQFASHFNLN